MLHIFSEFRRAEIWRELWILLASEEKKLGLPIEDSQILAMKKVKSLIDFDQIRDWERKTHHDVMSHVKAFGELAPAAEPIIHLGATSCFVTDNADVLILREATQLILKKLYACLEILAQRSKAWKSLAMTGYTHFQPAQPVTLGKRLALWAQDLIWDFEEFEFGLSRLRPLGCKGATGTQASFLVLFNGDFKKVKSLDEAICRSLGFEEPVALSGQTLSRKQDCWFLQACANLAASFSKISYDFRLLQHTGELREPFGKKQIGSSAMAYKRNPVLAERMTSLARLVINFSHNATWTFGTQWLERSLDDSANRRVVLPETFLAVDALLEIFHRLVIGMEVDTKKINESTQRHQAIFETEEAMMHGTLAGGSRQELHESIRQKTMSGKMGVKSKASKRKVFVGAADKQVDDFMNDKFAEFAKRSKKSYASTKSAKLFQSDQI